MAKRSNQKVVEQVIETEQVEQVIETEVKTEVSDSEFASLVQNLQESVEKKEVEVVPPAPVVKVEKNQGVGQFVRKLISQGMSNKDILKEVHDAYGNTQTTYACVAWYRNKMKQAQQQVKTTSAVSTVEEFLKKEEPTQPEMTEEDNSKVVNS